VTLRDSGAVYKCTDYYYYYTFAMHITYTSSKSKRSLVVTKMVMQHLSTKQTSWPQGKSALGSNSTEHQRWSLADAILT